MLLGRRLAALTLLVVAVALLPAASAVGAPRRGPGGGGVKQVHWLMTFEEQRKITWKEPPAWTYQDCNGKRWAEAHGSETLKLTTRRPVPVLAYVAPGTKHVDLRYNATGLLDEQHDAPAAGMIERQASLRSWRDGGACGGAVNDPPAKTDCGTRLPSYAVWMLLGADRRIGVQIGGDQRDPHANDHIDFVTCPLRFPRTLRDELNPQPIRLPLAQFMSRRATIKKTFSKSYSDQAPEGARPWSVQAQVEWKLVFRRAKR